MTELSFETLGANACAFGLSPGHHTRVVYARFLWGTLLSTVALGVMLAFDFVGRYLPLDPTGGVVSVASIIALGALFGFMLAFSKWIFRERWVIDCAKQTLSRERAFWGRSMHAVESVELEHVAAWVLGANPSGIVVRFSGGEQLALVHAPKAACVAVQKKVQAFLGSRRIPMVWEGSP